MIGRTREEYARIVNEIRELFMTALTRDKPEFKVGSKMKLLEATGCWSVHRGEIFEVQQQPGLPGLRACRYVLIGPWTTLCSNSTLAGLYDDAVNLTEEFNIKWEVIDD